MHHTVVVETRQRAFDRRQRADPGVEHEQFPATAAEDFRRDLMHDRLERRRRQAAAAGVVDEGRIISVTQRRPDQRVDALGQPGREPFGLDAVGIEGEMEAVLLGGGADRQYRGGAVADVPRDLVPHHALDKMRVRYPCPCVRAFAILSETAVRIPDVIQPCR